MENLVKLQGNKETLAVEKIRSEERRK